MGLMTYALGGALAGAGKGLAQQAQEKREEFLAMLRMRQDQARIDMQREEGAADRESRVALAQQDQAFKAGENALDREHKERTAKRSGGGWGGGTLTYDAEGNAYRVQGTNAVPVMGPDGKPLNRGTDGGVSRKEILTLALKIQENSSDGYGGPVMPMDKAIEAATKLYQGDAAPVDDDEVPPPVRDPAPIRETAAPQAEAPARSDMPQPKTAAEYNSLPSGARFLDPNGQVRIKP